jgi:hypothetical protein
MFTGQKCQNVKGLSKKEITVVELSKVISGRSLYHCLSFEALKDGRAFFCPHNGHAGSNTTRDLLWTLDFRLVITNKTERKQQHKTKLSILSHPLKNECHSGRPCPAPISKRP